MVISAARSSADISGGPRLRLWGSCPGGLEREAAGELHALGWGPLPLPVRDDIPSGLHHDLVWERGSVYGTGDLASVYRTLWAGRVVSRVVLLLGVARIDSLREVEEVIRGLRFSWLPTASFAIRTERTGEHSFRSPDVGRVAGQAVIAQFDMARHVHG